VCGETLAFVLARLQNILVSGWEFYDEIMLGTHKEE
jgi:hypothetical protein